VKKAGKKRRRRRSKAGPASSAVAAAPTPRARRVARGLRALSLGVVLGVVAATAWLFVFYPSERGPGGGHAVEISLSRDTSPTDLARTLSAAGLLSSPRLFAFWVRASGGTGGIVEGTHLVTDDASPREILARLERRPGGGSARVTFPEGWTRFDMARRLEEKRIVSLREFLDATTDASLLRELGLEGESAEGFLFPATYDLALDSDGRDVVRRMKREFDRRWDTLSHSRGASLTDVMTSAKMSIRDVVTLASMVEKEAAVDEERPVIASVFLNRLRDPSFKPKRLECDPTASYGCLAMPEKAASCSAFTGKATAAIEHDPDNPYSTYTHEGLPPGAIANPGAKSLEAVMAPANTPYFFFVARGEGRHTFSATFEAHAAAVHDAGARNAVGTR